MTDFRFAITAVALTVLLAGATEPGDDPVGPRLEDGSFGNEAAVPDDNPRIDAEEVVAPSIDSRNPAWTPLYASAEDPSTLECGGRRSCEEYQSSKAAEPDVEAPQ